MDTIAVVLRGHLRTWNYCKDSLFSALEAQYPDIDWYFTTWKESLSEKRLQSLHQDFENRKLFLHVLDEPARLHNPWRAPGRLCMEVAPEIRRRGYKTVIETRPDVHIYATAPFPEIQPNSFYTTSYNFSYGHTHHPGSADWFTASDANVFYTYAWDRLHEEDIAPHRGYISIAHRNNIQLMNLRITCRGYLAPPYRPIDINLIRPSIFDPEAGGISLHGSTWMGWDVDKKMQLLKEHDIAIADYDTGGIAAL